jgi:hypothetical protein
MPLKVSIDEKDKWIYPTEKWQHIELESRKAKLKVDANFYVFDKEVK